jgi:hypothetical protein
MPTSHPATGPETPTGHSTSSGAPRAAGRAGTPGYTGPAEAAVTGEPEPDMRCWPMVLPSHRDIVAAHCLPHLGGRGHAGEVLVELARADGPFGPAMAVALARGLVSARVAERETATAALLHLAGNGGLDAALLARELRALVLAGTERSRPLAGTDPGVTLTGIDPGGLRAGTERSGALAGNDPGGTLAGTEWSGPLAGNDPGGTLAEEVSKAGPAGAVAEVLAALGRAGAWHLVWAIAYDVVPAMVRLDRAPGGASALVAVAAEAAEATGARACLPEVAAAAGRVTDPRLRAETARLARAIG